MGVADPRLLLVYGWALERWDVSTLNSVGCWLGQLSLTISHPLATRFGYSVRFEDIGPADEEIGAPTQMGVFEVEEAK